MERERILLIDDEESIIKIISKILQDNGYEVETAVTKMRR